MDEYTVHSYNDEGSYWTKMWELKLFEMLLALFPSMMSQRADIATMSPTLTLQSNLFVSGY